MSIYAGSAQRELRTRLAHMNVLLALCLLALQPAALWCRSVDTRAQAPSPRSSESESESWESQEADPPTPASTHRNNIAELLLPLIERGLSAERRPIHAKKVIQVLPMRSSKERSSSWPHLNSRKKHVVEITPLRSKGRDGKPLAYILSPAKSDPRRAYAKRTDRHHAHHEHKDHSGYHALKKQAKRPSESSSTEEASDEEPIISVTKEEQQSEEGPAVTSEEYGTGVTSEESNDRSEDKVTNDSDEPYSGSVSGDHSHSYEPETDSGSLTPLSFVKDYSNSPYSDSADFDPDRQDSQDSDVDSSDVSKDNSKPDVSKTGADQFLFPESDSGDIDNNESGSENNDLSQSSDNPDDSKYSSEGSESQSKGEDEGKSQSGDGPAESRSGDENKKGSDQEQENSENRPENTDNVSLPQITPSQEEAVGRADGTPADNNDENSLPKSHLNDNTSKQEHTEESISKKDHGDDSNAEENQESQPKLGEVSANDDNNPKGVQDKDGHKEEGNLDKGSVEHKVSKELHEEKLHFKSHHEHKHFKEEAEYSRTERKYSDHDAEDKQPKSDNNLEQLSSSADEQKQPDDNKSEIINDDHAQSGKGHIEGDSVEKHSNEYNLDEAKLGEEHDTDSPSRRKNDSEDSNSDKSPDEEIKSAKSPEEEVKHDENEGGNANVEADKKSDDKVQKDESSASNDLGGQENHSDVAETNVKPIESETDEKGKENQLKEIAESRSGQDNIIESNDELKVKSLEEKTVSEMPDEGKSVLDISTPADTPVLHTGEIENIKTILGELQQTTSPQPDFRRNDILITQQDSLNKLWEPRSRDIIELIQSSEDAAERVTPAHCDTRRHDDKQSEHTHEHKSYRLSFLFNK